MDKLNADGERFDFLLSRRGSVASIAREVADVLTERGYKVVVQDYDNRPLFPLTVALPRMLEKIWTELTTAGAAEAQRLRQRAQLILDLLTPPRKSPIPS